MKTRGEIDGGCRLTGSRCGSPPPIADVFVAKSASTATRSAALCSAGHEGPFRAEDGGKLSLRASITGEIVMDGVEVGEDALLPNAEGSAARSAV